MHYVLKRLGQSVFTVFAVISLSFGLVRLLPGGPAAALRARLVQQNTDLSQQEINARIEAELNVAVDEPLYVQYLDYMQRIVTGDLGTSTWQEESVNAILADAIPWTVFLMATSLFLMFVIGVTLGAFMAYREGTGFDVGSTGLSLVLNSTPYYVIALLLLSVLGYRLGWFPTVGHVASGQEPGSVGWYVSVLKHGTLPIASLVLQGFGGWALNMRGNSIRILGEDYLRVARLRGLSERRIALRYVGRNAILPMYTNLLIAIGFLFGGAIILEQIFSYYGVGYYLLSSVNNRDYPLMMGCFILITIAVVVGVTIADLTYGWIDPRAGGGDSRETY